MSIILGIDPGSRITGYGVIEFSQQKARYIASGVVKVIGLPLPQALSQIFSDLSEVVAEYQPDQAAIEAIFMHQNASSALKLGQARGVAIAALAQHGLPVAEYSAREVKQAIVGYGAATKAQMQQMIKQLLNLNELPPSDAADALSIALCHAHASKMQRLTEAASR